MSLLTFDKNSFYMDGEPFRILAGDIHYFRIHPSKWERVLDLALDFGLNTVQTYVPWNAHEPAQEKFVFSGMLDLESFLALCGKKGLKVLLRPSPFICSEWDFGGLPAWLLKERKLVVRSSEPSFLAAVKAYYDRLLPMLLPYLSTNGGPIMAVAVENEYGSYGNDRRYLNALADMLVGHGIDVPLYTTDGDNAQLLTFGRANRQLFFGVNFRAKPGTSLPAKEIAQKTEDGMPFFIGEFWAGRSMHWGEPFYHRPPEETSLAFREALELGGNVCFYMFAGGTNFGFMGGANIGKSYSPRPDTPSRYIPHTTSYDVDALIGENGEPTEKYYLCRDVLDEHLKRARRPRSHQKQKTQAISVPLSQTADLFDNLDALTEATSVSLIPRPMEDYGQGYGLILYTTELPAFDRTVPLWIEKYRDRAQLYVEGEYFATFLRDRGLTESADGVPVWGTLPALSPNGAKRKIAVLVENMGRLNFGKELPDERKGLEDAVLCAGAKLFGYEVRTLPLSDLSALRWTEAPAKPHFPSFFKGEFDAQSGVDTYVSFSAFGHGYIWINGFNLGRYDSAGPQMTLFVPGALLREKQNEIVVLDINPDGDKRQISLSDRELLEGEAVELS